jgi:hypothetical protein
VPTINVPNLAVCVPLLRSEVVSHKLNAELHKTCRYVIRSSPRNVITNTSSLTALLAVRRVHHRTVLSSAERPAVRYSTWTARTSNFDHSRGQLWGKFAIFANTKRRTYANAATFSLQTLLGSISTCVSILRSHPVASHHISTMSAHHPMGTKCNNT